MEKSTDLKVQFAVKSFKRFDNPYDSKRSPSKYQFFVSVKDIPEEFENWLGVNPREQKLSTDVSRAIKLSLLSSDNDFHLLNRGILVSAESIKFDNSTGLAELVLNDYEKHGVVDGGHTLKIIIGNRNNLSVEKYVNMEVITGIDIIDTLAEARNTSVAVDDKSIENLKGSFDSIKNLLLNLKIGNDCFYNRIAFKQNEYWGNEEIDNVIDAREIIALINIFNPYLYDPQSQTHPIQSYSGKEASLRKFLNLNSEKKRSTDDPKFREKVINDMSDIIPDIFALWDKIEKDFPVVSKEINRRYGSKKYAHYKDDKFKKVSLFSDDELDYFIPKGIMYPCVASFRSLVKQDKRNGKCSWALNPFDVWEEKKEFIVNTILDSSKSAGDSPDQIGKSTLIWDSLYNSILIYRLLKKA